VVLVLHLVLLQFCVIFAAGDDVHLQRMTLVIRYENSQGLSFYLSVCLNAVLQSIARSSVLFACWYLLQCLLARLTCLALQVAGLFLFVCLLCVLNKWNLGIPPQARDLNLVYLQMITELDQAKQSIKDIQRFLNGFFLHICEVGGLAIMPKRRT
jgi:hypothetical protein